uniref:Pectate lyase-like n=1 Tax=Tanacetum cinerariifolium TaxID=118510 RepID=A0A6L2LFU2_TANCI|nr:pectate lyase-like [Tanacetum cinerariifolium]
MYKAFPLPVIEFPLAEEVPTTSKESSHCQKKRDAIAKRIALLMKLCSALDVGYQLYSRAKMVALDVRLDISTEMIGNFGDKILMLVVVDNVHGVGHVPSVDNIDYLRIHGSVSLVYCAYAFFTDVRILARQPQLDCGCSHAICVPFNFVESGRTTEIKNWSPQQPPQWAHFRHIHFGFMANHEAAVDAANEISMRQQWGYVSADMHHRKAETAKHSDNSLSDMHHRKAKWGGMVRLEADHVGIRGHSDEDAICLFGTIDVWID